MLERIAIVERVDTLGEPDEVFGQGLIAAAKSANLCRRFSITIIPRVILIFTRRQGRLLLHVRRNGKHLRDSQIGALFSMCQIFTQLQVDRVVRESGILDAADCLTRYQLLVNRLEFLNWIGHGRRLMLFLHHRRAWVLVCLLLT